MTHGSVAVVGASPSTETTLPPRSAGSRPRLQLPLSHVVLHVRWRKLPGEELLRRVEAMVIRRPQRAAGGSNAAGPEAGLTREGRYGLLMAASRAVADAGSVSPALYKAAQEGLGKLIHALRGDAGLRKGAPSRDRPPRAANKAVERKSSSPPRVGRKKQRTAAKEAHGEGEPGFSDGSSSSSGEEEAEADSDGGSGRNDDRCHQCSKGGNLVCCSVDGCPRAWHARCLPSDAMDPSGDSDDWKCPVCTKSAHTRSVANPKVARGKGRPKQRRYKSPHEAPKKGGRGKRGAK